MSKNAKGVFFNLKALHDRRHMVRAVMESICYAHRGSYAQFLADGGAPLRGMRVVGGGATSDVWMQMLSDVLGLPVEVPTDPRHTGALGAYYACEIGRGRIAGFADVEEAVEIDRAPGSSPHAAMHRRTTVSCLFMPSFKAACITSSRCSTATTDAPLETKAIHANSHCLVPPGGELVHSGDVLPRLLDAERHPPRRRRPEDVPRQAVRPCRNDAVEQHGPHEIVYGTAMSCQSGGPGDQDVLDLFLERLTTEIESAMPLDCVLISLHGAAQTMEIDHPEVEIVRRVRRLVGPSRELRCAGDHPAFASTEHPATARLVVRRVRDQTKLEEPFPVWRHHPFFINSDEPTLEADLTHRRHAVIETVLADLIEGLLAHLPSGRFAANSAWALCAMITHNLRRATDPLDPDQPAVARGATLRRQIVHVPARLARPQRRPVLHLPAHWPWAARWLAIWTGVFGQTKAPPQPV